MSFFFRRTDGRTGGRKDVVSLWFLPSLGVIPLLREMNPRRKKNIDRLQPPFPNRRRRRHFSRKAFTANHTSATHYGRTDGDEAAGKYRSTVLSRRHRPLNWESFHGQTPFVYALGTTLQMDERTNTDEPNGETASTQFWTNG